MVPVADESWPAAQRALLEELTAIVARGELAIERCEGTVSTARYLSGDVFEKELATVFRRVPLVVAHADEIPTPGDFVTHDATGVPLIVVRGRDRRVRAFKNTCMHRGTRLCDQKRGRAGAFSCPYHSWTYALDGELKYVPHQEAFPSLVLADSGLAEVCCEERHGLVWVAAGQPPGARSVQTYLGGVDEDLSWFGLSDHVVQRSGVIECVTNWKLMVEAFLEGYHVTILHRRSVGQFFHDARSLCQWEGPHMRALTARLELGDAETPREYRELATPSMLLFPNTVLVFQPEWISLITLFPLGVDRLRFEHRALVPREGFTTEAAERFERSWDLIHGQVFAREDIAICEAIQSGLASGALSHTRIGGLDAALLRFNALVDAELAKARPS